MIRKVGGLFGQATRRRYTALTRVCVTMGSKGVPVGWQTDWLSFSRTGIPMLRTRVEAVMKVPVTHGPLPVGGGGAGQPVIRYWSATVTASCPFTRTRDADALGCAAPPCAHRTVAP
jgi:hypothetical protein